jgi:hypothetical protein
MAHDMGIVYYVYDVFDPNRFSIDQDVVEL